MVVDEVEVPHHEMGANRKIGKIERSADASQGCHALIHCPFEKHYVKQRQVTARQIVVHVAFSSRLSANRFDWACVEPAQQEGAFPIKDHANPPGTLILY